MGIFCCRWWRSTSQGSWSVVRNEGMGPAPKYHHILHTLSGKREVSVLLIIFFEHHCLNSFTISDPVNVCSCFYLPILFPFSLIFSLFCRKDDLEAGLMLLSQAKKDCVAPTLIMSKCIISKLNGIEFLLYFTRNICTFPRLIVPELIPYLVNIYEFSGTEIPWRWFQLIYCLKCTSSVNWCEKSFWNIIILKACACGNLRVLVPLARLFCLSTQEGHKLKTNGTFSPLWQIFC